MRFQTIRSNSTASLFHECASVEIPLCLNPVPAEQVSEKQKHSATTLRASARSELTVNYQERGIELALVYMVLSSCPHRSKHFQFGGS